MKTSRFVFACMLFGLVATSQAQTKLPEVPTSVAGLLQDREFEKAIAAIDKELAKADVKHADYLSYLKARANHFQKKYDDAIKAFDATAVKYPKSDWARRARFGKGVSLAAKGDFRGAEQIYRKEAGFLLSADRKQEMSAIYLEFADAYFKPAKEEVKPDYQRALNFYQRALSIGPKPERAIEVELRIAKCNQKLNRHGQAITLLAAFVKKHADEPLVVEARFQLGDSQLAANRLQAARATWQDLLRIHAGSDSVRLPEAAFRISLTYGIPQPKDIEQLNLGVGALKSFIAKYPDHKLASLAYLRIAQSYQNLGRFEDAVTNLAVFLGKEQYAKTEEFAEARFNMAYALKMQQKFDDALNTWESFLVQHPTHKLWSNAQREIINTEYLKADYANSRKKYDEATQQWTRFLAKYPLDQRNPAILFRLGQIKYEQEKYNDAIQQWRRLVSKYPKTEDGAWSVDDRRHAGT